MLSLGKLCHHAAFLRDAPPHSDDDVAAGPAPTAPPVPGVLLAVDASEREEWRAVGVAAADDEHYLLRMQEKLPWLCKAGGAAAPAEALLESLLATAASPALCAERHVSQEEVLKLSLDVAHKSAWRLGDSARGRAARSERLVRVLAAAANADGQAWLPLSSRLLVVECVNSQSQFTPGVAAPLLAAPLHLRDRAAQGSPRGRDGRARRRRPPTAAAVVAARLGGRQARRRRRRLARGKPSPCPAGLKVCVEAGRAPLHSRDLV